MLELLNKPGLPQSKVTSVLISGEYPQFAASLNEKYNIEPVITIKSRLLSDEISSHSDCLLLNLNENTIVVDDSNFNSIVTFLTNKNILESINILKAKDMVKSPYPNDVRLNVRVIADKIICNTNFVDENIKRTASELGFKFIHCNQGYAACSSVILNDNAIITDDISISCSAQLNGIDCLYVNKGSVQLKGYDYGFIGGTCGMIDKNKLAFTGKLVNHSDVNLIESFLNKYNIDYVELSDGPLVDIGGIIPLTE